MTTAELIAQTREAIGAEPVTDTWDIAEQVGKLKYLAEQLCIELEDAIDPDGKGRRLMSRLDDMNARLDALASRAGEAS